ncbi:MAG: hypothetical protein WA539_17690, partial [Candidatus Sulfotelmatobacter sp.]
MKPEVAHGASGGTNVEGIACVHQDNAQMIGFNGNGQATCILRQLSLKRFAATGLRGPGPDANSR